MTYRGHIKNGVVVFDEAVALPEGSEVEVIAQQKAVHRVESEDGPTLAEQFKDFIGIVDDLPSDFAEQHDHYIHGTPKR